MKKIAHLRGKSTVLTMFLQQWGGFKMTRNARFKPKWHVFGAMMLMASTSFIAGCPLVIDDLFSDMDTAGDDVTTASDGLTGDSDVVVKDSDESSGENPAEPADSAASDACAAVYWKLLEECDGGYRYIDYVCADGTTSIQGGDTSCKPEDVWVKYASEDCAQACNTPSDPTDTQGPETCDLEQYTLDGECDGGYYFVEYTCSDGFMGKDGDGKYCGSAADWKDYVFKQCVTQCNAPPEPADTDDSADPCELLTYKLYDECDDGYGYKMVEYMCGDGNWYKEGGYTSCKSEKVWVGYAMEGCANQCGLPPEPDDTDTSTKCGVADYTVYDECDGGFLFLEYACMDGQKYKDGDGVSCLAAEEWEEIAAKTCYGACNAPNDTTDTEQQSGDCEMTGYKLFEECDGGFLYMEYECSDGMYYKSGDGTKCIPELDWKEIAVNGCISECNNDSDSADTDPFPQCGMVKYNVQDECESGFGSIVFICTDDKMHTEGDGTDCQPEVYWVGLASKYCDNICIPLPEPVDTDSSEFCGVISMSLDTPCDNGFRYIQYDCGDGKTHSDGDDSVCYDAGVWKEIATKNCSQFCD